MLRHRHGDTNDVSFLKGVAAKETRIYLTGDGYHGDRIHVSGGNTGNEVCRTRAGGSDADTYPAAGPGIAVSGMGSTLLMAYQYLIYSVFLIEGIVKWQNHSAGIAEYCINPCFNETFDNGFCSCH